MVVDCTVPGVDRRFLALVGVSVALHAALFAWVRGPVRERPLANTLITATLRLVIPESSTAAPGVLPSRPAAAPSREARQLPPPRGNRPVRAVAGAAGPQNPVTATTGAASAPAASAANGPVAAAAAEVPPIAARPQASLLDAYGRQLAELLSRRQEYPRIAALRGWEGEVRLRLKVARQGSLLAVNLERSSGFDVLDQHALALLAGFATLPPLPDGLDAHEIQVVVPVNYRLKKTT